MLRNSVRTAIPRLASAVTATSFMARRFLAHDAYVNRHIGPTDAEIPQMLQAVGASSLDEYLAKVVPTNIKRNGWEHFDALSETDALKNLRTIMSKNRTGIKSLIGQGFYEAITPPVILRNVLESPGWYTPYTPYQAEIAQGRLESLLNYQTMVTELTKMDYSNGSLLDLATAASESMFLAFGFHRRKRNKIYVAPHCYTAVIEMVRTRAEPLGIEVVVAEPESWDLSDPKLCGVMMQTPDATGAIHDFTAMCAAAKAKGVLSIVGTDLLACTLTKPAGEMGADVCFGSAQRLGIPMGFGGPHAAFFAVREPYKRVMPGRLIGISRDRQGKRALRMALQTREQHIKREHATSNICTAQALLANMSAFYAIYHGPDGLKEIAQNIHTKAKMLAVGFEFAGHTVVNANNSFDTITVILNGVSAKEFAQRCVQRKVNVFPVSDTTVSLSTDEATTDEHITAVLESAGISAPNLATIRAAATSRNTVPSGLVRSSPFLTAPIFNSIRSESGLMRYIYDLQRKDFGLNIGMIPLGSCTMKLNAAATMIPMSWAEVGNLHPFVPEDQAEGYRLMCHQLEEKLKAVTGFAAVSLQPNSGAQGEYAGLRVIRAYHQANGQGHRNAVLIPTNAHGTNPATCTLVGYKIVPVQCEPNGKIDLKDLAAQIAKVGPSNVAGAMITYPSTFGVFDSGIKDLTAAVHEAGGQVYIDGANFNAMVGYTGPEFFGGDVCHINMHKTFSIPHGGGGPGMGPIGCRAHLAPFLPNSTAGVRVGGSRAFGQVSHTPYGSASILNISYMEMMMLGSDGLKKSTAIAILNANYLRVKLQGDYKILYVDENGNCAHEFILDLREFKQHGVEAEDVAKRLMDYGFHAPTLSFPVAGTLMVEPSESEPLSELNRFVDAMKSIRREIQDVIDGKLPKDNNPLKHAPHTAEVVTSENWARPYGRQVAAFPVASQRDGTKFWPTVSRIDNEYGDLNLMCSCAPMPQA